MTRLTLPLRNPEPQLFLSECLTQMLKLAGVTVGLQLEKPAATTTSGP
jgi:hypothetical protein